MLVSYLLYRYLRKGLFVFSVIGLSIFYGTLTSSRNFEWQSPRLFYEKIVKLSPESFQAHNNLGLEYEYARLYEKAIAEYKKALDLEPGLLEGHSNLANLYFKVGRLEDAKREYAAVAKTAPGAKAGEVQNNIGCVYEMEGKLDEALNRYKLSLRLDPNLKFTHFNIARIYFARKDLAAAVQEILKSLPEINLADDRLGPYLKIVGGFLNSIKDMNCSATFYNNLGVRFAGANFLDAAVWSFQRVLELEPEDADAHFNLGLSYWKTGLRRQANFEFKTVLKLNPEHIKAKRFLSEIVCPALH
jgi:tetratricopeptide (TPR) repeat protein